MDAKALAKSKRAHSQHHKNKSHPNQKSQGTSVASDSAGSAKKSSGKLVGEKARQSQRIAKLPSNRDRYEGEFDSELENLSGDSLSKASDVIVPKSKGADYHFLIAEALSQAQSHSYSNSDSLHYLDDILPGGFIQEVGPLLSARGEAISSWGAGDDNFVVEDKRVAVQEASFLSLNLNALAEQVAKIDLSQRLFVEADLLSSEQGLDGSRASSNHESDQMQTTHESDPVANISEDIASNEFTVKVKVVDTEFPQLGSPSSQVNTSDATVSSKEPHFMNHIKDDLNSSILAANSGQSVAPEPTALFKENIIAVSDNKLPKFEAAEAELDMLLDSFDETKSFDSSGSNYSNTFTYSQQAGSATLPSNRDQDLLKTASAAASFNDVLDDLLRGTSNLKNQNGLSEPPDIKAVPHDTQSSSQSVTKSKDLEDFDSWLDSF